MQRMVIPCESGEDYLTRLRIIHTPLFGIYLHDLSAPDADSDPHDHPWDFISFIVKGRYYEELYPWPGLGMARMGHLWRRFTLHRMTTEKAHRIIWVAPHTKSLIFVGRRKRNWGFYLESTEWVSWQDYEKAKGLA